MYPDSFLQWLGTIGIIFGILIVFGVIVLKIDYEVEKHRRKHKDKEDQ